ncbi:MAG: hypothetical protein ABIH18_01835 [Candidatus Omnitrophota bacterium]
MMRDEGREKKKINSVKELDVYRLAFDTAMEIYTITMEKKADMFCK